jgi:16S rRNA (guanine527-N7)-methyltransferase
VQPFIHGNDVVDVGSGAGLPGIPLALVDPTRQFTLLDSNGKKAAFLRHAVRTLGLANANVARACAEAFGAGEGRGRYSTVLSRAFAHLDEMIALAGPLCAPQGRLLAMKARLARNEIEPVKHVVAGFRMERIEPLHVPGLAAERHLVILCRS